MWIENLYFLYYVFTCERLSVITINKQAVDSDTSVFFDRCLKDNTSRIQTNFISKCSKRSILREKSNSADSYTVCVWERERETTSASHGLSLQAILSSILYFFWPFLCFFSLEIYNFLLTKLSSLNVSMCFSVPVRSFLQVSHEDWAYFRSAFYRLE